jgi:outer membrane protein TolC
MQLNMLYVLEAREKLYEAQKEHIAALGQAAAAEVELEFVLGGRLPEE